MAFQDMLDDAAEMMNDADDGVDINEYCRQLEAAE